MLSGLLAGIVCAGVVDGILALITWLCYLVATKVPCIGWVLVVICAICILISLFLVAMVVGVIASLAITFGCLFSFEPSGSQWQGEIVSTDRNDGFGGDRWAGQRNCDA